MPSAATSAEAEIAEVIVVGGGDGERDAHALTFALGLDLVPDQRRDVGAAEILHRADAGRRGDVDLGEKSPITSMPTNSSPRSRSAGPSRLQISRSRLVSSVAAGEPPRTMLERRSSAAGTRLTAPAYSPSTRMMRLSPSLHRGQEFLHHPLLAEGHREHVVERAEIEIVAGDAEHRAAAVAVERLHHDVAVLGAERLDLGEVARDQRRRHQLGKFGDEDLFRRVAHAAPGR